MTRQALSSIFLFFFLQAPTLNSIKPVIPVHQAIHTTMKSITGHSVKEQTQHTPTSSLPSDNIDFKPLAHKIHVMKMEELAHIHHFHKERVKKIRKHHNKYWMLAKTLLVVCHIVLLISAFLHLTH
jgi:hypothetical protein